MAASSAYRFSGSSAARWQTGFGKQSRSCALRTLIARQIAPGLPHQPHGHRRVLAAHGSGIAPREFIVNQKSRKAYGANPICHAGRTSAAGSGAASLTGRYVSLPGWSPSPSLTPTAWSSSCDGRGSRAGDAVSSIAGATGEPAAHRASVPPCYSSQPRHRSHRCSAKAVLSLPLRRPRQQRSKRGMRVGLAAWWRRARAGGIRFWLSHRVRTFLSNQRRRVAAARTSGRRGTLSAPACAHAGVLSTLARQSGAGTCGFACIGRTHRRAAGVLLLEPLGHRKFRQRAWF